MQDQYRCDTQSVVIMISQISTSSASKTSKSKAKPLCDQTNLPKINKYFKPVFNYKKCILDFLSIQSIFKNQDIVKNSIYMQDIHNYA